MPRRLAAYVMSDNRYYVKQPEWTMPVERWSGKPGSNVGLKPAVGCYILYFPKSSSFNPSSHFLSSSLVTRSDMLAARFEVFSTTSSTKIGQSTRSANASASDGRESIEITSPPRSSQITA